MIVFTSDIDWAPELIIQDTVDLFGKHGAKCTFFATHKSDLLLSLPTSEFEVGLHPNFNELLNGSSVHGNSQTIMEKLLESYPHSKGVRSHSLTQSSQLLELFKKLGLVYESNQFVPYQQCQPHRLWNGLLRLPYNWEDDVHWLYGRKFDSTGFNVDTDTIVADFHPIHVFLNTDCEERYNSARKYYQSPKDLRKFQNRNGAGARTLLISLLEAQAEIGLPSLTMTEFAQGLNL